MFRQRMLVIAATLLLHVSAAGVALGQTGPLSNPGVVQPNTTVRHLDRVELLNLLEARNPDVRCNCQQGVCKYTFTENVRGVAHRIMVVWLPSEKQVFITVTVSESFSAERAALVEKQLPEWNKQINPHTLEVLAIPGYNSVLVVSALFADSVSAQDVVTELDHVLESVAKAQPLWGTLR